MGIKFDKQFSDMVYGNIYAVNEHFLQGINGGMEVLKGDKLYVCPTDNAVPSSKIIELDHIEGNSLYYEGGCYALQAASFIGKLKE